MIVRSLEWPPGIFPVSAIKKMLGLTSILILFTQSTLLIKILVP